MSDFDAEQTETLDSEEQRTAKKQKMPNFTDEIFEWAVNALAVMSVQQAVAHFLLVFPGYDDPLYGDPGEVRATVLSRFRSMKSDKRMPYAERIRDQKAAMESNILDVYPYCNEIAQLTKLHELMFFEDLKPMEQVRILSEIRKICDRLRGPDGIPKAQAEATWAGSGAKFEERTIGQAHRNLHEVKDHASTDRHV